MKIIYFYYILLFFDIIRCFYILDGYRLFQLEKNNITLGTNKSFLNSLATIFQKNQYFSKYIVLIPIQEVTLPLLEEIIINKTAGGIIILIPEDISILNNNFIKKWENIEKQLINKQFHIPFYFILEDITVKNIYKGII